MAIKISLETWINRLKQVHNTEEFRKEHGFDHYDYSLIENIRSSSEKITIKCIKHDYTFQIKIDKHYYAKQGCRYCTKKSTIKLTDDEIDKRISNRKIIRLEKVITARIPIKFKCTVEIENVECGFIWKATPDSILRGTSNCLKCSNKKLAAERKFSNEDIDLRIIKQNRQKLIKRIGNHINVMTYLKWLCLKCDYIWEATPDSVLGRARSGCPKCNDSKGELEIFSILTKLNFKFDRQFSFPDCKYKRKLKFDFVVYNKDGDIIGLIEYQGKDHYPSTEDMKIRKPSRWNDERLKYAELRDQIKRDYCIKNNLLLIEIPYWEFNNIEKIIKEKLNKAQTDFQ